ncbi:putative UPF0481 protein [Tanacetum coccineum]
MSNINNKQPQDLTDYDGISQSDVTTKNLSNSDEASTPTLIFDRKGFLLGCAKKGGDRNKQRPPTICKVSRVLREISESPFNPQLVSIGPIHREDPKLQEFEWLKECYLHDVLHHDSTPEKTFGHRNEYLYLPNKMQNLHIAMDLMLLENQVPFFVLQALFDCTMGKAPFTLSKVLDECLVPSIMLFRPLLPEKNSILSNVLDKYLAPYIKLFCSLLPGKISTTDVDSDLPKKIPTTDVDSYSTHGHVLGYLHKRYQLVAAKSSNPIHAEVSKLVDEEQAAKSSDPIENAAFHSIVELDRSGMNFKPHQEHVWSMTIKFQSSLFAYLPCNQFPQDRDLLYSYDMPLEMLINYSGLLHTGRNHKSLVNILGFYPRVCRYDNKDNAKASFFL